MFGILGITQKDRDRFTEAVALLEFLDYITQARIMAMFYRARTADERLGGD